MRREFSEATKRARYEHCKGICECGCNMPIVGRPEYHHAIEAGLKDDNSFDNCRCLSKKCHRHITSEVSIPRIAKVKRISDKAIGLRRSKHRLRSRGFHKPTVEIGPDYDS